MKMHVLMVYFHLYILTNLPENNKSSVTDKLFTDEDCFNQPGDDIKSSRDNAYRGKISKSKSGKPCLRWDSKKRFANAMYFPDASVAEAANYCRVPFPWHLTGGLWCVVDQSRATFEKCQSDCQPAQPKANSPSM